MNIRKRLMALESSTLESAFLKSDASAQLMKRLQTAAERLRETPLSQLTSNASPMEIAALVLDRRVDDEVARQCFHLSKQPAPSAKLFQCFMDAAGCSQANLTEES